ncbi:MAG TPA: hypothetical protein VG164_14115, partial [Trebonia sp.]|nr:hypothetical protein [Trebonia sp.]
EATLRLLFRRLRVSRRERVGEPRPLPGRVAIHRPGSVRRVTQRGMLVVSLAQQLRRDAAGF